MEYLNYIVHFLLGGILFTLIYHFSKKNDTVISSIIPAFPTLFLVGFIYYIYFGGNKIQYVQNCVYTFSLDVLFFLSILLLYSIFPNNFLLYFGISFILYLFIIMIFFKYKVLK